MNFTTIKKKQTNCQWLLSAVFKIKLLTIVHKALHGDPWLPMLTLWALPAGLLRTALPCLPPPSAQAAPSTGALSPAPPRDWLLHRGGPFPAHPISASALCFLPHTDHSSIYLFACFSVAPIKLCEFIRTGPSLSCISRIYTAPGYCNLKNYRMSEKKNSN